MEIATDLVALCNEGKFTEAINKHYGDDIVSIEPMPGEMQEMRGIEAIRGKMEWWEGAHEVHSASTTGPWVNGDQFAVQHVMDVTAKESGQRFKLEEIAVYTVANDKIVHEKFFYNM